MMAAKSLKGGRFEQPSGNGGLDASRASPDSRCVICLGDMLNKSFTDSCLHQFCFVCLVKWSKVKAECPLCKQPFKSIIHNVRSNEDYDQYHVPREQPSVVLTNIMSYRFMFDIFNSGNTPGDVWSDIVHALDNQGATDQLPSIAPQPENIRAHQLQHWRGPRGRYYRFLSFRSSIYRRNLWVRPLVDVTGRFRECSVEYYRENPGQLARLAPWVNRECRAIFLNSSARADSLFQRVMDSVSCMDMQSSEFRALVAPLLEGFTDHFIHELYTFARSPFDIVGFDTNADYTGSLQRLIQPRQLPAPPVNADPDSDVEVIPGPNPVVSTVESPIVISSDSDSDVVMLPKPQRTPRSPPEVLVISSDDEQPRASTSGRMHRRPSLSPRPVRVKRALSSSSDDSRPLTMRLRRVSNSSRATIVPKRDKRRDLGHSSASSSSSGFEDRLKISISSSDESVERPHRREREKKDVKKRKRGGRDNEKKKRKHRKRSSRSSSSSSSSRISSITAESSKSASDYNHLLRSHGINTDRRNSVCSSSSGSKVLALLKAKPTTSSHRYEDTDSD